MAVRAKGDPRAGPRGRLSESGQVPVLPILAGVRLGRDAEVRRDRPERLDELLDRAGQLPLFLAQGVEFLAQLTQFDLPTVLLGRHRHVRSSRPKGARYIGSRRRARRYVRVPDGPNGEEETPFSSNGTQMPFALL